jgi:hypothetical protein
VIGTSRRRPRPRHAVERATPDDWPDLAAFRSEQYGPTARQLDERQAAWLFGANPAAAEDPDVWICRKDGVIVGQQCGIPVHLKAGSSSVRGSWAIDLVVDPEWRMRGVAPVLSDEQAASADVALALNVSPAAYRAYRRGGWTDLGTVPLYVRPLRLTEALDAAEMSRVSVRALGRVADAPLRLLDRGLAAAVRAAGFELRRIERFDERADVLWRELAPEYPVLVRRDLGWLRWRFDDAPGAAAYVRFYLQRRGRPLGYLVLRTERRRGHVFAVVADYFVRPALTDVLFALALHEARDARDVALACRTLNARGERWLRALGFGRLNANAEVPVRFLALVQGDVAARSLLATRESWFVTAADSDLDHDVADGMSTDGQ